MEKLANRLKELRGELSYYEVGKVTGVHRNHIKLYENGQLMPSVENLDKLAEYYEAKEELYFLYLDAVFPNDEQKQIILNWAKDRLETSKQ